jgi:hypothetical protein
MRLMPSFQICFFEFHVGLFESVSLLWTLITCNDSLCTGQATSSDFENTQATSGVVTFAAGQTTLDVSFAIFDDTIPEDDEVFYVVLSRDGLPSIIGSLDNSTASAMVTILANDNYQGKLYGCTQFDRCL